MSNKKRVILLFSGGKDSLIALQHLLCDEHVGEVFLVCYDYGQKNSYELVQARNLYYNIIRGKLPFDTTISFTVLNIKELFKLTSNNSGLLSHSKVLKSGEKESNVSTAYVPNRNLLFIALAHNIAISSHTPYDSIYTGSCPEAGGRGYPDNTYEFYNQLESVLKLSSGKSVEIDSPFFHYTLTEMLTHISDTMGDGFQSFVTNLLDNTLSCHNNDVSKHHWWGYGCGECGACKTRETELSSVRSILKV